MADFDLVIFDCDGVLVDSEILAREAMRAVYRDHGIDVTAEMVNAGIGMKLADIVALIETQTGTALAPEHQTQFWPRTQDLFSQELLPTIGIADFLEHSAIPRCVASSSHPERIRYSLAVTGLAPFFAADAIFSSQEVANGKPAPDLVLHAAARMKADPARCLVIEDSRFGIMGAKAAGMTAWGYVGGTHLTPAATERLLEAGADAVTATWDEVAARLDERPAGEACKK